MRQLPDPLSGGEQVDFSPPPQTQQSLAPAERVPEEERAAVRGDVKDQSPLPLVADLSTLAQACLHEREQNFFGESEAGHLKTTS
jgi:hypothetical protein